MINKTAIILLNFNSYVDTDECLQSILDSDEKNYSVIVVDNASIDDSLSKLKLKYLKTKHIIFIENKFNGGVSYGCNVGIRKALDNNFDFVLLLNNDTIVTNGFLTNLQDTFKLNKGIGVVGGTTYVNNSNMVWDAGGYICHKTFRGIRYNFKKENPHEVKFITCCYSLISSETFKKIGMLSEDYFFGSEEWDFSLNASRNNILLYNNPSAIIYHKVGKSHDGLSIKMIYNSYRNRILFVKKNFSKKSFYFFLFKFMVFKFYKSIFSLGEMKKINLFSAFKLLFYTFIDGLRFRKVSISHLNKF